MKDPCRFLLLFLFVSIISIAGPASASAAEKFIYYMKLEGTINPGTASFVEDGIEKARGAEALIIELDTPGGLDLSMRDMIKAVFASDCPVVVYVAPPGSRAASAGVFILYAANIAAMAPGTNIGSAHPVTIGGGNVEESMAKKVENDAAAYIRSIALKRKRNADWAEKAVRESVNITDEEALKLHVIDLVAPNMTGLISKIDGMEVALEAGPRVINTKGAAVKEVGMGFRYRVLSALSNPNIAYIFMMIGLMGLFFELANPGSVLPGVVGVVCLILAFYAFQTLPVNYAGLLLIGLGIILFILEIKVASYGLLTVAGIASLFLGSLMLFGPAPPFMRLSPWVALPAVTVMAGFVVWTMYYGLYLHRKKPVSGAEGIVGDTGTAVEDFEAGMEGKIFIEGEYWNAVSDTPVKKGERVRVTGIKGLQLKIRKA